MDADHVALGVAEEGDVTRVADVHLRQEDLASRARDSIDDGVEPTVHVQIDERAVAARLAARVLDERAGEVTVLRLEDRHGRAAERLSLQRDSEDLLVKAGGAVEV